MKVLGKNGRVWPTHLPIVTTDPLQPEPMDLPMSYIRVLPRDLFNEANLLKCLGALWIAVDGQGPAAQFDVESVEHFDIRQDPNDGSIFVANLLFSMGGRRAHLSRPLNSRNSWPLYISFPDHPEIDVTPVFADDGKLSVEFTLLMITA